MAARAKGYLENWEPKPETALVLSRAREVLAEYRGYGPMTVRQVFYRLVGQHGYEKTERAYKRLAEYVVKARRARLIPFHAIRDDGTVAYGGGGYEDAGEWWDGVEADAERYQLDHQLGQPVAVELWCEAGGMAPMLARMVREWHVPVYSTGGFSSVTVTHEVAQRVLSRDRPTAFLHVGDFDPSGESIFESMSQDIGSFVVDTVGGTWNAATGETVELADGSRRLFQPRRVALTADQVEEYDLPTAPPKASDSRSAKWLGETTQAEAMPPDLLEEVVRAAVEDLVDADELARLLEREAVDRDAVREAVKAARP